MRQFLAAKIPISSVLLAGLAFVIAGAAGCGTAAPQQAKAKGKVTLNGEPVKGGKVTFASTTSSGYLASGDVKEDGTFVLSTADGKEGAPLGKGRIAYSAPAEDFTTPEDWDSSKGDPPRKKSPYEGMVPKQGEVEIKSGDNELAVELAPGSS